MDNLDLRILAAMFQGPAWQLMDWDPRVSTAAIAEQVGASRSTVWARFQAWESSGFLRGYAVLVNPALFGARIGALNVRLDDRRAKDAFLEELALVDGVVMAFDHVGPWTGVGTVCEGPDALARRARIMTKLEGVGEVEPGPFHPHVPVVGKGPDRLDWRILRALCGWSGRSLDPLADEVGVSARTVKRRYERLIASRAAWFVPLFDSPAQGA